MVAGVSQRKALGWLANTDTPLMYRIKGVFFIRGEDER